MTELSPDDLARLAAHYEREAMKRIVAAKGDATWLEYAAHAIIVARFLREQISGGQS